MKAELNLIPTAIVNPSSIVVYNQVVWYPSKPTKEKLSTGQFDENGNLISFLRSTRKAEGQVSPQAKRKISKAIDYLIATSREKKVYEKVSGKMVRFTIAFVTLTLPSKQIHSDKEIINKCLNSLLLEAKKYYEVKNYVWRAEKQQNGNIHFHLLIDKFIPYYELRNRWNRIVNKLGYVDRYQDNMKEYYKNGFRKSNNKNDKRPEELQYIAYQKASTSNYANPNSTDIHSTKKIKNLKAYVTKYLTKSEPETAENEEPKKEHQKQTGRVWSCNHELGQAKGYATEIDNEIGQELTNLKNSGKVRIYEGYYFTVYNVSFEQLNKLNAENLFYYFANYLLERFNYNYQMKIAV